MIGFLLRTQDDQIIRFKFYRDTAPLTSEAFGIAIPFSQIFLHAKVSGQEIWTDNAPALNIGQENCSIFAIPGEIVIGPLYPVRNKIAHCMGIFYGEGKLLDAGNIFAKVIESDLSSLQALGEKIWRQGAQELSFEKWDSP